VTISVTGILERPATRDLCVNGVRAQADRMLRLGVLKSADAGDPKGKVQLFAFTEELAVLGWADGPNLRMEIRGVAATSIGHRFLPKSWSSYSRM